MSQTSDSLERHFWRWAALFVVLLLACSIVKDVQVKMWSDEIITVYLARQANAAAIVQSSVEGCDVAPPLYTIIVHSILPIVRHEALAVRLPSTLGYCGMVLCLFAFCRRRLPAVYSFIAALLACDACLFYSTDGRAYGLVLGCAAGALLCWQTAAEGRRRGLAIPLLAFCLALMVALHYFSIFFLAPLFLAEMVRARSSRKLDFGILAALAPAVLVLVLHYPVIAANRRFQAHYWSPAHWSMMKSFYNYFFFQILYVCSLVLIVLVVSLKSKAQHTPDKTDLPAYEWVAIAALALTPPVVVAVSRYTTHIFVSRYVLWALIGTALLLGTLLCKAFRGLAAVGFTLLGFLMAFIAVREVGPLRLMPEMLVGEPVRHDLETLPASREPIVIPDQHVFMELSYDEQPRLRERFIYPLSRDLELRYRNYDALAISMGALRHRTQLHIEDYDAILAEYPRFLLAAVAEDYLPQHLADTGYRVVPIRSAAPGAVVYEVEAPHKSETLHQSE
ncbi:MAG: hypothetical protein ACLQBJ_00670 [Bryobacteraceae bacterium]